MGIDPTHLINHDLQFTQLGDFVNLFAKRTNMQVKLTQWDQPPVSNYCGWDLCYEDYPSLEAYYQTGPLNEIYLRGFLYRDDLSMNIHPNTCEVHHNDFYMGRWFQVKYLADWIKGNGIPPPEAYAKESSDVCWILQNRKRLFEYGQWFGIKHMVIFCDDKHQEWLNYFCDDHWSIEQFVEWGKTELLFVKFQDLVNFNFPDDKPDYYNVFIYDDFEDLRQEAAKWQQPTINIHFETFRPAYETTSLVANWLSYLQYLREEAAKWNLDLKAKFNGKEIEGTIHLKEDDFSPYLAKRLIELFFEYRGWPVKVWF